MFHFIGTKHASNKRIIYTMDSYCYCDSLHHDINDLFSSYTTCAINRKLTKQHYSFNSHIVRFTLFLLTSWIILKEQPPHLLPKKIIAVVDHFAKLVETEVISSPTAKVTASFILSKIIARHSCPQIILTDN